MNRDAFKALSGAARATGTGMEYSHNGRRAYYSQGGAVFLDTAGRVERGRVYTLNMAAGARALGLFKAARDILRLPNREPHAPRVCPCAARLPMRRDLHKELDPLTLNPPFYLLTLRHALPLRLSRPRVWWR